MEYFSSLAAQQSVTEIENYLNRQISELQGQTSTSQVSNPLGELWKKMVDIWFKTTGVTHINSMVFYGHCASFLVLHGKHQTSHRATCHKYEIKKETSPPFHVSPPGNCF